MVNIAIDGPSGAGKSTVANILSIKLGIMYLDTGAMYRAAALKAIDNNIDISDKNAIEKMIRDTVIDVKYKDGKQNVFLDGNNVTMRIHEHSVSKAASDISAIPVVRLKLVEVQRKIASGNSCILDGRDIGTYVLPNAEVKVYLTADSKKRAERRQKELNERGQKVEFEKVLKDIEERDKNDSTRAFAPLKKAEDAIEIDSTNMTAEDVSNAIIKLVKGKSGE
ncbi:MAG: (d)CMP kinase [Clostridia bacterium]